MLPKCASACLAPGFPSHPQPTYALASHSGCTASRTWPCCNTATHVCPCSQPFTFDGLPQGCTASCTWRRCPLQHTSARGLNPSLSMAFPPGCTASRTWLCCPRAMRCASRMHPACSLDRSGGVSQDNCKLLQCCLLDEPDAPKLQLGQIRWAAAGRQTHRQDRLAGCGQCCAALLPLGILTWLGMVQPECQHMSHVAFFIFFAAAADLQGRQPSDAAGGGGRHGSQGDW